MGFLIVEDDSLRRRALEDAIRELQRKANGGLLAIDSTDNLSEAITMLRKSQYDTPYDVVIMGWDFPSGPTNCKIEENGGELLKVVRRLGLKAIICTNRAGQLTKEELLDAPVILPIPLSELEEKLAEYIA